LTRRASLIACILLLNSCAFLGYGTRTEDLGDGKYRVLTPAVWDSRVENRKASEDLCPDGYRVLKRGQRPDSAFNVTFLDSDFADYWIVQCTSK